MKNRLSVVKYLFLFLLLLFSCASSPVVQKEKREVVVPGEIAYGDIRFGDDQEAVSKGLTNGYAEIGGYGFDVYAFYLKKDIDGEYDLWRISFEYSTSADFYDTSLRRVWQSVIDVISDKYGNDATARQYPEFMEHSLDDCIMTHVWVKGNKIISISVCARSAKYSIYLSIEDAERTRAHHAQELQNQRRIKKESSDKF